ncbi:hypothetical protein [Pelagicoccus sp. SDUM812002]|uniref:hypothetical protein n=1 Tax=Pelagicoccus sp. SDUM812002 TaxID=3041266 RepID=UPI00280CADF1|nr:hypothetical protein [Pelagicoccus sp. SDUM812002]MDQ8184603.1 hypothetical protein [Pelagicoccus sp. SDUM812002]
MSENKTTSQPPKAEQPAPEKKGFFTRIVNKLDGAMKEKADQKSQQGCCDSDGKGGRCC